MTSKPTLAVVGLGLIGGSLYKAALKAGYETLGLHHGETDGLGRADVVFVCLPSAAIVPWLAAHAEDFRPGATVVDIAGVKRALLEEAARLPRRNWTFVGGHPMAGREVSGFANATDDLFVGASMILTPFPDTPDDVIARLRALFADLGFARTVLTTGEHHDAMIAFTSQLCHVIATAYARDPRVADAPGYSAGSYANMTRIATQDPDVWADLYATNRRDLLDVLDGFVARLGEFRSALATDDGAALRRIIREGADAKRRELAASKGLAAS